MKRAKTTTTNKLMTRFDKELMSILRSDLKAKNAKK
jgi:hypothetical protein